MSIVNVFRIVLILKTNLILRSTYINRFNGQVDLLTHKNQNIFHKNDMKNGLNCWMKC